jgi:biopolymer transport protein TolQ
VVSGVLVLNVGFYVFVLQTQALGGAESGLGGNVFDWIAQSSALSKLVLLVLVLFSVLSWAIVIQKLVHFRRLENQTKSFLDVFRRSKKFSEVQSVCRSLSLSPLVGVFQAGYAELNAQLRQTEGDPGQPTLRSFETLDRALIRASAAEANKLENRVHLLATTASITPFIGLFGTVMGIVTAFQGIAGTGSTNLTVVAPGIAEALIATAAGLAAAIPAVYFYNHLTNKVKLYLSAMDDFSLEFLSIAERNFT